MALDAPPDTTSTVDLAMVARAHRATDPLHTMIYFGPEAEERLTAVGIRPGRMCYFASRAAPMGAVTATVVTATFYNFNPELVARFFPRAWTLASPEAVLVARLEAADAALRRLLGDAADGPEVAELAELTRAATSDLPLEGRPLFAGHAGLDWPDTPLLVLWHAASLLREYRGDGHLMALQQAGLNGIESIVTHTGTGRGFTVEAAKTLRGWSDEQWAAAIARLRDRGLWDDAGLSPAGQQLRAEIEQQTDALDTEAWRRLGPQATARVVELGRNLSRRLAMAGAFPAALFAAPVS